MFKLRNLLGRKKQTVTTDGAGEGGSRKKAGIFKSVISKGDQSVHEMSKDPNADLVVEKVVESVPVMRKENESYNEEIQSLSSLSNPDLSDCSAENLQRSSRDHEHIDIDDMSDEEDDEHEEIYSAGNLPEDVFPEQAELVGYKLISKIGTGAFSNVYRGIPDMDHRETAFLCMNYKDVAVKVIKKEDISKLDDGKKKRHVNESTKTSSREQVLKEVVIHKSVSLGCDQIVAFIDFQETENYFFIIQELLNGGEIFGEIVRLTYFSEDLCRHVIIQLALAVKHLHSMGVVHRDIKPENLLFEQIEFIPSTSLALRKSDDPNTKKDEGIFRSEIGGGCIGTVKLVDFGLSKQIYSANTQTPCGTVGYTAPEVVKDEKYSMKVDMWGVGCVLYTILCGFPPFYDEKIDTLTEKIARGEFTFLTPWWDEISPGAKNAVSRLLEVDPEKRYDVDDLLNDPWLKAYDSDKDCTNIKKTYHANKKRSNAMKRLHKDTSLLYSPAAVAMRDAFDVSNAVQRIEEDKVNKTVLNELNEDEECEDFSQGINAFNNIEQNMFQLKLDSSTIIKRRQAKE